jgi:glycosyltransferase involved in cell wall biosynthesis
MSGKDAASRVSIVIPCRNEAPFVRDCLDSVLAMEYPADRLEILVVDGMSTDGTRATLEEYARRHGIIRVLDNPQLITPAALNRGIRSATGEIVMRLDAHSVYPAEYVARSVAALEESGADCVGGVWVTTVRDGGWFAGGVRLTLTHPLGVGNARYRLGVREPCWVDAVPYGCFRRDIFVRAGLYNEVLERSQDFDLWSRIRDAGGRILLHPNIRSTYRARGRLADVCRYNFGNGFWVTWPIRLVGTRFSMRHLIPLAFVSLLLVGAAGGIVWPALWSVAAVAGAAYLAATIAVSARAAARERDVRLVVTGPVAFAILHLSYGLGSLWGLIRPLRSVDRRRAKMARAAQAFEHRETSAAIEVIR